MPPYRTGQFIHEMCPICSAATKTAARCKIIYYKMKSTGNDAIHIIEHNLTLLCPSCDYIFFMKHTFTSEDMDNNGLIKIFPNPYQDSCMRLDTFNIDDINISRIYTNVCTAIDNNIPILASIGLRTLVDATMICITQEDMDNYTKNIINAASLGLISEIECATLKTISDMGSRSAHACYSPEMDDIKHLLRPIESIIERLLINKAHTEKISAQLPPRKQKKKNNAPSK